MISSRLHDPLEAPGIGQSAGRVLHDMVTLAELQGRLFKSDALDATERVARPTTVLIAAATLLVATIPVALLAIGEALVAAGLGRSWAYSIVALASIVIALVMGLAALRRLRQIPPAFQRSTDELGRNIRWIKSVVRDVATQHTESS